MSTRLSSNLGNPVPTEDGPRPEILGWELPKGAVLVDGRLFQEANG
jgi:hypothetical protein